MMESVLAMIPAYIVHETNLELADGVEPSEDPRDRVTGYRANVGRMVSSHEQ